MTNEFVHLHNHTEYSRLDGLSRVDELCARAAELGQPAVAITDHGTLAGAYQFWRAAKKHGIKPIIGIEAYVAPDTADRKEPVYFGTEDQRADDVSGRGAFTHMTLLAEDEEGLRNLFALHAESAARGFYYKPRVDIPMLASYAGRIHATTGCPGGRVQTHLRLGQYDEAQKHITELLDIFGYRLYVELMCHGVADEDRVREDLYRILEDRWSINPLVTNDLHYVCADDADTHDALICVQTNQKLNGERTFKFEGGGYYLKSREEMRAIRPDDIVWHVGMDNTVDLVNEAIGSYDALFEKQDRMPQIENAGEKLRELCRKEWGHRIPRLSNYAERMRYELDIIESMGYPAYFLVVADLYRFARDNGIRVGPGRGSVGGSLVAYALRITEVDPIKHSLVFERFLNPDRVSMPDIDMDWPEDRRHEALNYIAETYGTENVAHIGTVGRLAAKQALKDSARVLGMNYDKANQLSAMHPKAIAGFGMSLSDVYDESHPRYPDGAHLRGWAESDAESKPVVELARKLETTVRNYGIHAAGIVIADRPLSEQIPLRAEKDAQLMITEYDMHDLEDLGFLKLDFLGLSTLTVIDQAMRSAGIAEIPMTLDDPRVYGLFAGGQTSGLFQVEGYGMRKMLREIRPDTFDDLAAAMALYRPGPMALKAHETYAARKHRHEQWKVHPDLEETLSPTYGLMIYQEQLMGVVSAWAGYTMGQADIVRKACGKKDKKLLASMASDFMSKATALGRNPAHTQYVWNAIQPWAEYGFPKAHAVAYAMISYQTAWLKAYAPREYMAALLTNEADDQKKVNDYLNECRYMNIPILPADVNESGHSFTPTPQGIRYGLAGIKGVGSKAVEYIVAGRPFKNLAEWEAYTTQKGTKANKKVREALAEAGALSSFMSNAYDHRHDNVMG